MAEHAVSGLVLTDHESYVRRDGVLWCDTCNGRWPCDGLRAARAAERDSTHDHGPGERDPEGHIRCVADGFRWPCPEARRGGVPLTPDDQALLELVEPGWSVHKRVPGGDVPGGIVLGFEDTDDGRVFTVLDWPHGRPRETRIALADVDPLLTAMPDAGVVRDAWRRLCRVISEQRGASDGAEVRWVEIAFSLTRLEAAQ